MRIILAVLLAIFVAIATSKRISPFFENNLKFDHVPSHVLNNYDSESDAGEPLILSDYLDTPELARRKSCVDINMAPFGRCSMLDNVNDPINDVTPFTYSGYFTVNQTYDQNLFYWFFEAQSGKQNAPILIWLQGGPGGSSLFGLFSENGPFAILNNLTMVPRNITWNTDYHMIYIDNPVNTGFSYSSEVAGCSSNQDQIAYNLHQLLIQFYQVFPQYVDNELYITGESYAGKYIPAFAYYILQQNPNLSVKINLAGVAIGDGLCDPVTQVTQYANLAYYTGLADIVQQETMMMYQDKIVEAINQQEWGIANDLFTDLINGPPDYFQNITGEPDYYDIRRTVEPSYGGNFELFVNQSSIRNLLHVGNHYFQDNNEVYLALQEDIPKSVKPLIPTLIENIKVMFYNGQFDFIVGVSTTETFIRTIPWSGIGSFIQTDRVIWYIPTDTIDVAGYVRHYQNLTQVVVRGAGHIVPFDQSARAYDMITRFSRCHSLHMTTTKAGQPHMSQLID
ncbi:peptidase S10 family protein [Cavenderia fasciculata]|uniref:Carboxypeptidase n=1 Tax=Cavenderia fasciculata TaxID=261658 RepID=F4QAF1_CACFS|nr:peptidase S10 family protein [Cavenderia fasciculata]EGG15670.1 peptidase S10 family protein [Cavenderia fasciculata]|eukprot:XP_004354412.1 peptidase S10 family protein [Cavenderia fasciculata]